MGDVCLIAESMEENGWCPGEQMPGSVIAWDLVRVVNLARWSYLCGYLNEDEMWQVMQLAADTALEHFSSWEEYGASFVMRCGRSCSLPPIRRLNTSRHGKNTGQVLSWAEAYGTAIRATAKRHTG